MAVTSNSIVKGKDLPDFRNFLSNPVTSPFTITGSNPTLNFEDTTGGDDDYSISLDADVLRIQNTNNNATVLRLVDGAGEDFDLNVDTDILSIINTNGPITYIRFRGGASDDIQVDRPITFNSTVSGLTFTDITLSDASPTITFTDTSAGDDDFTIGVDADLMTITNTTQGSLMTIGKSPLVNIVPIGAADTALRVTVDNQTSSGITVIQIVDNNNATTNLGIRSSGETRVAAGYPSNLSDVPSKQIVLGGQLDQDITATGNVGAGTDTILSFSVDGQVLANDGDTLQGRAGGLFANNANTKQIVGSFGGTAFFDSTAVAFQDGGWTLSYDILRRSSSSVVVLWVFTVNAASGNVGYGRAFNITGLDLTISNTFLITGAATSDNDVTCEAGTLRKFARAQ